MDNTIVNGKFSFKILRDGSIDRTKVICIYCKGEFNYHRSTSSLKYHLSAKHTANAESPAPPPTSTQSTLDNLPRRYLDRATTRKLGDAITKWVSTACRPINIVEDEGLREIIRIASNDWTYEPPSRTTTMRNVHTLYEQERAKIVVSLGRAETVALTGDYWTSLANHSYLGVTAHYFDEHWGLMSHALTVMKTEDRHFANVCAEHFTQVAREWDILDKVSTLTTDSARNMIAAARELPFNHMPCAAHLLQRSITVALEGSPFNNALAKCRRVVGHFKHSPPNAAELEQQQRALGKKTEAMVQDVKTRWNSTLDMVSCVLRNKEPLAATLAQQATSVTMPTEQELDKLHKLKTVLEPCKYVTELLGGEKYVSCSVMLPAFRHVSRNMEVSEDDPAYLVAFKNKFSEDLEQRKEKTNIPWLKVATALDPRFKDLKCLNKPDRAEVWSSVTALLRQEMPTQHEGAESSEPPRKRPAIALLAAPDASSDEEDDCVENWVARYRAEPPIALGDCPLQWWSDHEGAHSMMARLARKYLATPATSVPCERLFSLSGNVVQKKRASLLPENVNKLVSLSNWLKH